MPLMHDDGVDGGMGNNMDGTMDQSMNAPMQVDHLDVDDLFGEDVTLALPNVRAPSKELRQRVDDLRTRGCCQGIAWSKFGTVASISPDGQSVQARCLRANPADGSWGLSEPTTVDVISASASSPIVHLAWANTSSQELAVIDATGRVAMLAFSVSLNRPFLTRKWDLDHTEDLNAVTGCFWLELASQHKNYHILHGPAVKEASNYRYESSYIHAFGPWHPNPQKSAFLCVTVNGLLRLFWTQSNNKLEETRLELESVSSSDDLITHAALHSDKNHMYIALATASKQLRLVCVSISWGLPQTDQKLPPGGQTLRPALQAKYLAISSWMPGEPSLTPADQSMSQISHIELLPSQVEASGSTKDPIKILVVRSYLPGPNTPFQEAQSIIDGWELYHEPAPSLHPAFEQMGSRKNSVASTNDQELNRLKKLESTIVNKVVLRVQPIHHGKVVCFAYNDGSIEYRDRTTMQEVYNDINFDSIMSLSQVGFTFNEEPRCLQVAFSPTHCSVVQMLDDGRVKWNGLQLSAGDIGESHQDARYSAVIAGLTLATSTAAFYHGNIDDVLAVAQTFAEKPNFARDWLNEIVRMVKVPVDYSEEPHHDALMRNTSLQLCLSILNHLGFKGEFKPRAPSGKFAFASLSLRNAVILITIASNTPTNMREKLSPLDEHEVVDALVGCAKWSLDLFSWLSDRLFGLMEEPEFRDLLQPQRFREISGYLRSQSNPSLQLLLCSSTRGFIVAACRRLQHLEALSQKAIEFYERRANSQNAADSHQGKLPHVLLYKAYQRMQHITHNSLVKASEFEQLLNILSKDISSAYQTAFASLAAQQQQKSEGTGNANNNNSNNQKQVNGQIKAAQVHSELGMLLTGQPPPPFLPVLKKFFETDLRSFKAKTDPAALFFANFELLELSDATKVLDARRAGQRYVDAFRRVEMAGTTQDSGNPQNEEAALGKSDTQTHQWRRCVRCAAVMTDLFGSRPGFTFVLAQQRKCACGGNWALLPKGFMVL